MRFKKLVEPIGRLFGRNPNILDSPRLVKRESKVADDPPPSAEYNRVAAEQSPAPRSPKEEHKEADDPEPPSGEVGRTAASSSSAPPAENHTFSTAKEAVKTALTVLKECLDGVPVPGLKAAVGGVLELMKIFENVAGYQEELERLANRIRELEAQIRGPPGRLPGDQLPAPLQSNANSLVDALNAMAEDAKRVSSRSLVDRTANHDAYKQMIQNLNVDIDRLIASFTMATTYRMERTGHAQEEERLIREMPHANARYDDISTKPSRACHPNTRTDLRQTIGNWIDDESSEHTLFWLCGEVGVGKTTVAHTIAKERDALHQLGASFFFNRDHSERRDSLLFASTIAYQLARYDPEAYQVVVDALRWNPDIVHRNLQDQFSQLVVQPLTCIVKPPSRTVLIVIDGLDECNDPVALLDVLPRLIQHSGSRLRVLITSRPHAAIVTEFKSTRLCHLTSQEHFRNIDSETLNDDVRAYLEWSLGEIATKYSLHSPWPTADEVNKLVNMASGLFVLASVLDRYIRDPFEGNPSRRLQRVLSRKPARGRSPTAELDAMYDFVLNDVKQSLFKDDVDFARNLLQLIFLSSEALSVNEMSEVLDSDPDDVLSVLRRLASVLRLQGGESDDESDESGEDKAAIPFHASFGEYIQDPGRCSVKEFMIEPAPSHAELVPKFLEVFIRAAGGGITGIEYDYSNTPPHNLKIADRELCHHVSLASDPAPLPCQQVEDKFCKNAVLIWSFIRFCGLGDGDDDEDRVVVDRIKKAGFATACCIQDEGSIQHSMVKRILDEMPHLSIHRSCLNDCSNDATYEHSRIADEVDLQQCKIKLQWCSNYWIEYHDDPRYFGRMLWKWSKLQHPNIVSLRGIDFGSLLELSEQPKIYVPLTSHLSDLRCNWYPELLHAFRENSERAVQIALEIARVLQYLLESGFYESIVIDDKCCFSMEAIVLSKEGKLMIHPLFLVYKDSVSPSPTDTERRSLSERGLTDWYNLGVAAARLVWHFGCVLYEMMTGIPPLKRYDDLVNGSERIGDETTVRRLLEDLEVSEDLKGVLQACWVVSERKRPPIQDIVARLETILKGLRTGGAGDVEDD